MRSDEFKEWLSSRITKNAAGNYLSRCKSVEKALGVDLDEEFSRDKGANLFKHIQYSAADARASKEAPEGFTFKTNVNINYRLINLRSAVRRYFDFCKDPSNT